MRQGVAEFHTALGAHILMLVPVVLGIFGEAHRGETVGIERRMIAAAPEAIEPVYQRHGPVR